MNNTHVIIDDASTGYVVRVPGSRPKYFADYEEALRYARAQHRWPLFNATWEFNDPDC
jgi:hypothetical protein